MVGEVSKKPPCSVVAEALDHRVGQRARLAEPARVEARLVEGQQRLEQVGVILEVGVEAPAAVLPGAQQPAVGVAQRAEHEVGGAGGGLEVVGSLEHRAGLGQRGDHQGVPGGQALVVEPRPDALRAHLVEAPAPLVEALGRARAAHRDVGALEVAAVGGPEPGDRLVGVRLVPERRAQLVHAPDVELALDALRVGVERREEAALGRAHLAQRPVERLLGDAPEQRLAGHLPAVQVRAREQRVVVEHLLEVGDEPVRVDRVAREAAADLVVHPARVQFRTGAINSISNPQINLSGNLRKNMALMH